MTKDNWVDLAAVVGAAAWVPQVVGAVNNWLSRPKLQLIAGDRAQFAFADLGLFVNVSFAMTAQNKDALVSSGKIRMIHEKGDERVLVWSGMQERQNQLVNDSGESIRLQKQHDVMALKVSTGGLTERSVLFRDEQASEVLGNHIRVLYNAYAHQKSKGASDEDAAQTVTTSPEFKAFALALEQCFYLHDGRYKVVFEFEEAQAGLTRFQHRLQLTAEDVSILRSNGRYAKEYFMTSVGLGNYPILQFRWPTLEKGK